MGWVSTPRPKQLVKCDLRVTDIIATIEEVAAELRVKQRWLRRLVRAEKIPVLQRGRVIRFDALARAALHEALRAPCPSKSSGAQTPAHPMYGY